MKKIATYSPSVEELTDKIRHIVDNYMFENKMDQANIMSFVYDNIEYDKVKLINTPGIGKEIAFLPMRDSNADPIMLTDLIREARQNGNIALLTPYFSCRSLFKGDKVFSKVGTHQFLKGEDISSIHKDLYGEFKVLMVKKERSLLHPFGRDAVTLRNIKNTDRLPFKIYPSEMKDVSIAVKPRINSYRGLTILEDVNKDLNKLALKDFDIELSDYIFLSAKDFNPNIENQYSSNAIDTINVRNGRLESFHMKDTLYHIQCLSKSGLEKVENAVKSKIIYLRKFASETFEKQEKARLSAKARELQDMLAKLPGMEPGKTIKLDKGIPLDDKVVVNSIGDMVVDEVTYLGNAYNHAIFQVTDGGRDIPFSRMMEWNQEQVAEAVIKKINEQADIKYCVQKNIEKDIQDLMDQQNTDKIDLPRPFGVESKPFGQEAIAVVKVQSGGVVLSDGKNTLPINILPLWQVNELANMVYEKPLHDLLKDGEKVGLKLTADNSMSSGYKIDKYMFESITKHGDNLLAEGVRQIETQGGQGKSMKIGGFPVGCTKQVYDAVKSLIEEKRAEEKTYDSLEYDGKTWSLRSIVLPTTGEQVLVGTIALEQALLPDDGHAEWKDRKAKAIDERIFYYVEEEELNLPSKELAALVESEALDYEEEQEVSESVGNKPEDRLLSDTDIAKQYSDFKVNGIKFYSPNQYQNDSWSGVVDLEFPNATHPDFDETMVNPFISYDKEGKQISFDYWMPEETYKGVCDYIRAERPKYLVMEAMIERTIDSSAKAFTSEQQQVILNYLKDFDSVDKKMQALAPLWEEACKDYRMDVYDEWKEPVKEELNNLASGVVRDNSRGRTP